VYVYVVARFAHAAIYVINLPQPARALAWQAAIFAQLALAVSAFM
jgi:hypothetical protein